MNRIRLAVFGATAILGVAVVAFAPGAVRAADSGADAANPVITTTGKVTSGAGNVASDAAHGAGNIAAGAGHVASDAAVGAGNVAGEVAGPIPREAGEVAGSAANAAGGIAKKTLDFTAKVLDSIF